MSPWKLERDSARPEIRIADFRKEHQKTGDSESGHFRWVEGPDGTVALASNGDFKAAPLIIRPDLRGHYAVFVTFEDSGGLIQSWPEWSDSRRRIERPVTRTLR